MKILLVEDNKSISDNLKYTFNMNNIDLDVTNNIKSTKDYLEYNKPSLIILDVTLSDVNDNTVTVYMKRIREKLDSDIIITLKGMGYRIDEK